MRISDWSSDVCSSDLCSSLAAPTSRRVARTPPAVMMPRRERGGADASLAATLQPILLPFLTLLLLLGACAPRLAPPGPGLEALDLSRPALTEARSEEHTSELQSLMRISYAVFCLKKKN